MKSILVTGAHRPLSLAIAKRLAHAGHRVLLTAPDLPAARAAAAAVREDHWSVKIDHGVLDLTSFASIRRFASELPDRSQFDVLIHGPGHTPHLADRNLTVDGVEETLSTNAIAPYLLSQLLLPTLLRGRRPGRVVFVAARRHLPGTARGTEARYDVDDPNLDEHYRPDRALTNAELARLWVAYELARKVPRERLTVHSIYPGYVPENEAPDADGAQRFFLRSILPYMPFATGVDGAAERVTSTALSPMLDRTSGMYWAEDGPGQPCKDALDPQLGKWFWKYAERVTKSAHRAEIEFGLRRTVS